MANWILTQQIVLSISLILLLVSEKLALKQLGTRRFYLLWWLLPLALLVNNLPHNFVQFTDPKIYQYLVKFEQGTQSFVSLINWQFIWLSGVVVVILGAVYSQWKISSFTQSEFDRSQLALSMPDGLRVVEISQCHSPLLLGLLRPTLVLPTGFQQQFSPLQQQLILQHELVHYHRADNLFNALAVIFVAFFWFNPLVWLAYPAFRRSQELACDHTVLVNKNKNEKIAYSKALLLCLAHPNQTFSLYSQYGAKHAMLNRIEAIKHNPPSKTRSTLLTLILSVSLLSGITLANQQTPTVNTNKVNEASPVLRIEPKYPIAAAQQNIEGSVLLQFDINQDGSTANIKVIKAEPEHTFDKVAITALEQWRYKPQIIGGQPQLQANLLVQLDFRMDEHSSQIKPLIEGIKVLN